MDFTLSKEHEMARQLFKEFAENEVKPLAQEVDETETFPRETVEKMAKYGFMGIPVPKEYGGQGCDTLTYAMCVEELSKVCATTGVIVSAHTSLCIDPIMNFGTEEQKKKYVPDLASGRKIGAFGLTEPGAGTDAQGQQTKAVLDGDEWVINGSKCFITNGKEADVYIVIAVTGIVEKRGRKMKEISSFIVEKGTPGFTFGTKEKKMGIKGSSTYELIFTDCRIPKENMLGKQGQGFKIAMHTLDGGRIGIASQALGIAEGALERTVAYTKERKQFGKSISGFQNTQFQLADMATKVEAAKMLVYKAARKKDEYKTNPKISYSVEAAMAKLYAAEVAMEVTTKAVQLHGGAAHDLENDIYSACLAVITGHGQGDALAVLKRAHNDKLARLCLFGDQRGFNDHLCHGGVQRDLFSDLIHRVCSFMLTFPSPRTKTRADLQGVGAAFLYDILTVSIIIVPGVECKLIFFASAGRNLNEIE